MKYNRMLEKEYLKTNDTSKFPPQMGNFVCRYFKIVNFDLKICNMTR